MPEAVGVAEHSTARVKTEMAEDNAAATSSPSRNSIERDDVETRAATNGEERENLPVPRNEPVKRTTKPRKNKVANQQRAPYNGYNNYPPQMGAPYPPPPHGRNGGNGGGAYPPAYYGAPPHDYRGHPSHHPHFGVPPHPHSGQPGPPHYPGPGYGPPPPMAGRPGPPPGYHHPPYPGPYPQGPPPPMYAHGGSMYPPPPHGGPMSGSSDSTSISSSKSRSTKSHASKGSRKKRTIDGVHSSNKDCSLPLAYTFRRSNSSASTSSSTASRNNTNSIEESPRKRERTESRSSRNIFEEKKMHRRSHSGASTTSSLSGGGFSLSSYDGQKAVEGLINDIPMEEASKRRKATNKASIFKKRATSDASINGTLEQLSMNESHPKEGDASLFLSLSTSPINHPDVDATPQSKNSATRKAAPKISIKTELPEEEKLTSSATPTDTTTPTDTPTPTAFASDGGIVDDQTLNKHLRGHSFTPLPQMGDKTGPSPTNAGFTSLAPQLSWSIAGDTPSLEDLAACSWEENEKDAKKRPDSTTSADSRMIISPHNFSMWKEEHESTHIKHDNESPRLSMLSPHSELAMAVDGVSGTTTPLPLFFADDKETSKLADKRVKSKDSSRNMFGPNSSRSSQFKQHSNPGAFFNNPPTPVYSGGKPMYPGSGPGGFAQSPMHGDRRDHYQHGMYGHHPGNHDRVRNLRGRLPPGAHLAPMPLHIPPPMSTHHPLTSPMGIGHHHKGPMWSPHHGGMPPMASPHHMSPMDMSQSKRKCVPLKPPIPSKFQGDMDKMKSATVPEFTSLVNFPAHMSQKQSVNLPEGMRCCVMCGQACPCSMGNKKKGGIGKGRDSNMPRGANGQELDKGSFAIIPTQNKGLCTLCDVNVWVVVNSCLEIKWCKGCKNFRPWAAFGDKGLATKCLRCRERQREKYALQKEEKEKARLIKSGQIKA